MAIIAAIHSPVNLKPRARRPFGQGILGSPAPHVELVLSLPVRGDARQFVTITENPTWFEEEDPREFALWTVRHWKGEEQVAVEPYDTFGDAELAASLMVSRVEAAFMDADAAESWGPEADAHCWELGPDPDFYQPAPEDSAWLCLQEAAGAFGLPSISGGAPDAPRPYCGTSGDWFAGEDEDLEPEFRDLSNDASGAFLGHDA
jgi:hypothetical protein